MSCVNNMHEQYRLSDGSFFTDYRNSHEYNREIMKLLNSLGCTVNNNYDYKLCLIKHADKIADLEREKSFIKNGFYEC